MGACVTTLLDSRPEVRCAQYRHDFHLPAAIDPSSGHILLTIGADCGAVTMPAELGELVQRRLAQSDGPGPVIHHPRAQRWTFITGPGGVGTAESAELFRLYATVACTGSRVVLPSADDERTGHRTWAQPPEAGDVPALKTVIELTRALGIKKTAGAGRRS